MNYQLEELSIELSARCQCRCIMCSSGSTPKPMPNELDAEEIMLLLHQARELGATVVSFSGGDPILLYEVVPGYILAALRLGYERILFYTTGVSLSINMCEGSHTAADDYQATMGYALDRLLDEIDPWRELRNRLAFVFSLHSYAAHVHNYIMGVSGAFGCTVSSICDVVSHGYQAWVHMVPMLPNWNHARRLRKLCGQLGVSKMSLLRYVPQTRGRANRRRLALSREEFAGLQHIILDMSIEEPDSAHLPEIRVGCPIDFRHTVNPAMDSKGHPCHAGTDLMLVRPTGNVHPCAAWKTLPDDANVRAQSLEDIWTHNHVFQAIRQFREYGWSEMGGPCSMCTYLGSCKGGCPAQKLHWLDMNIKPGSVTMDDLLYPVADPLCPIYGMDDTADGDELCPAGPTCQEIHIHER